MKFKFLDHTADIKIRAYGKTLNEAFESIALALSEHICKDQEIKSRKGKTIRITGSDIKNLLYKFIEEIIYLLDAEDFVVTKSKVDVKDNKLNAKFYGGKASSYHLHHVKAPTYAEMHIKKKKDMWEIQAVVDV